MSIIIHKRERTEENPFFPSLTGSIKQRDEIME